MVRLCVAAACYSTVKGVRLFQFPKTPNEDESALAEQVRQMRDCWEAASDSSVLCSRYFEADYFEDEPGLCKQFSLGYRA